MTNYTEIGNRWSQMAIETVKRRLRQISLTNTELVDSEPENVKIHSGGDRSKGHLLSSLSCNVCREKILQRKKVQRPESLKYRTQTNRFIGSDEFGSVSFCPFRSLHYDTTLS